MDMDRRLRAGCPVRRAQPGENARVQPACDPLTRDRMMAATAIYSVLHAVVLDPFPYKDVDRLMSVRVYNPAGRGGRLGYSVDQFLEISDRSTIFDGVIASTISDVLWTSDGDPQRLRGNHGTFNTFVVMGVPPLLAGRRRQTMPVLAPSRWSCSGIDSGSGSSAATATSSADSSG